MGSFAGQRTRPIHGVKGSKGGAGSQPRQRLPKMPAPPEAPDLQAQSSRYLLERNKQMRAKRLLAEMDLAEARERLIQKELAIKQVRYLLIGMRQKTLGVTGKMRMKFGPERFDLELTQALTVFLTEVLTAISQLPDAVDPNWLQKLEDDKEA